jgi:diadenosine tetraphosphate (Ap4A) HIT family hydrolase
VDWPASFYELKRSEGCPMCAQGRPEETEYGVRILAGEVSDAYLQKAGVQRGYSIVIWRGRHVAEPTELDPEEGAAYWRELLRVGQALDRRRGSSDAVVLTQRGCRVGIPRNCSPWT